MPDEKGETRRQRNERFGQGHLTPDEIHVDEDFTYLLEWFWDLNLARSMGFNGPNPISYSEIAHWSAMTGNIISRREVALIRKMDAAYVKAVLEDMKVGEGVDK